MQSIERRHFIKTTPGGATGIIANSDPIAPVDQAGRSLQTSSALWIA